MLERTLLADDDGDDGGGFVSSAAVRAARALGVQLLALL